MKYILVFLLIIATVVQVAFSYRSKKTIPTSTWQANSISIDGDLNDWAHPPNFYDRNSGIGYGISNDSTSLFLCFRIVDEKTQMKILGAGMTVSLDTNGKKKQHVFINYPLEVFSISSEDKKRPTISTLKTKFKIQENNALFGGFKTGNDQNVITNKNGVTVKVNWDNNSDMIYELAIPFNSFWKEKILEIDTLRKFSLNVKVLALERPNVDAVSGATQGGSGGGGRPSGSGGGSPSGVSGRPENVSQLFEEQRFNFKFKLAIK